MLYRLLLVLAVAYSSLSAQHLLASPGTLLGTSQAAAWVDAGGTVQVFPHEDSVGIDTGVPASFGIMRDGTFTIGAEWIIRDNGTTTRLIHPAPGPNSEVLNNVAAPNAPAVVRTIATGSGLEWIERFDWSGSSWDRTERIIFNGFSEFIANVQEGPSYRLVTVDRDGLGSEVVSMYSGNTLLLSYSGFSSLGNTWSGGVFGANESLFNTFGWTFFDTATLSYFGWGPSTPVNSPSLLPGPQELGDGYVGIRTSPTFFEVINGSRWVPAPVNAVSWFFTSNGTYQVEGPTAAPLSSWDSGSASYVPCQGSPLVNSAEAARRGGLFLGPFEFFSFTDATGHGVLVRDDSTGTVEVLTSGDSTPPRYAEAFGQLLIIRTGSTGNQTLWSTDGTLAGTRPFRDFATIAGPSQIISISGASRHALVETSSPAGSAVWRIEPQDLDWSWRAETNTFYRLTEAASFGTALGDAASFGGHLVIINDQAEQDWLQDSFGSENLWIGLSRDSSGTFRWVDGSVPAFESWCPGEPNGALSGEYAVHLANYPGFCIGHWNDQQPSEVFRGIVERATPPTSIRRFGTGCQGHHNVVPQIQIQAGRPSLGTRMDFRIFIDPSSLIWDQPFLFIAPQDESWEGIPLPLDLGFLGGVGCQLWVPGDMVEPLPFDGSYSLTFPTMTSMLGTSTYMQGVSIDFDPRGPWRFATSEALELTLTR